MRNKQEKNNKKLYISAAEEKVLHLRGHVDTNDDMELELASHDPLLMRRLLALEANIIAAARERGKTK